MYKQILRAAGFKDMIGWECLFYHEHFKVILSVYVDDFQMAGRKEGLEKAWRAITGPDKLALDPPEPFGRYLGVSHTRSTITRREAAERVKNIYPLVGDETQQHLSPKQAAEQIPLVRWQMDGYWQRCVDRNEEAKKKTGSTSGSSTTVVTSVGSVSKEVFSELDAVVFCSTVASGV